MMPTAGKTDKTDTQYQDNHGVRSLTVSNDGKHLASGDREGNIRYVILIASVKLGVCVCVCVCAYKTL